eukprot:Gregarina_sp_Poly_1__9478@NODE_595_length_7272_cov_31_818598_g460_i0_p3_GENE_NODE_595_length_7272_cov_31_818598_g460_i0NODE_595_length_7272_cov_31_818598_g460_i0_p3_ORF_typecomplete_len231_score41_52TBCA/PF02970_16/6_5e05TBCA/PF02970_16/2_8e03DUF2110/PF09883_9/0_013_NODE_595_length_7272_cov_31_818598_g460_i051295821
MRTSIDRTNIRAQKDSVQGILHDLKMKSASFLRCYIEYGTYVDELQTDKTKLAQARAQGEETKQLEAVEKETADMIPITQRNVKKIYNGFVEFWGQRKTALERGLQSAPPRDREKWLRELNFHAKNLEKMGSRKHNPLAPPEAQQIETIISEIRELASTGRLPGSAAPVPSATPEKPAESAVIDPISKPATSPRDQAMDPQGMDPTRQKPVESSLPGREEMIAGSSAESS